MQIDEEQHSTFDKVQILRLHVEFQKMALRNSYDVPTRPNRVKLNITKSPPLTQQANLSSILGVVQVTSPP